MKAMKKIVSLFLVLAISLSVMSIATAQEDKVPVVFVAGYTSSRMWVNRGTPNEKRVWKQDVAEKVIAAVKSELPGIIADAGAATVGIYDPLFNKLEPYVNEVIEELRMNDDGTSKYDVELYPHSVEDTRLDSLKKIGYLPDHDSLVNLGAAAGDKNVYCCTLDWRYGQIDNAKVLNDYIDEVLAKTGAGKINLMGVSYGGQVVSSYLSIYGGSKVNNVVLHSPALNGSSIVSQLLSGEKFSIAWSDLLELYQAYSNTEMEYSAITDIANPAFLDTFIYEFLNHFLIDLFINYGSVWDLVPLEYYADLRDKFLNDGKHDAIIEKSDRYHFEVAANIKQTFNRLRSEGVDISIVAGYGSDLAVGNGTSSDGVIDLSSTTGAKVAKLGTTLGPGYKKTDCGADSHYHLSADGTVDAAVGYLPENTWYVSEMYHGLGFSEKKTTDLLIALLLTDDIKDVHASPEYPQFLTSQNRCRGVYCSFSNCAEGYLTKYSTELTVKNLSKKYSITVDGIFCTGAELTFGYSSDKVLAPGESMTATVRGFVPSKDLTALKVTVNYIQEKEKYPLPNSRTQSFLYTSDMLLDDVLTIDTDSGAEKIAPGIAKNEGAFSFKAIFVRIGYYIYKITAKLLKFMGIKLK
ncbi:MAG: alpha/beta fold hydrolase [Clostridiales bacterium]|nr:alpha/beta fold hydrolase [Clostridiales bacterium]